ncbi:hypothetical protein JSR06_00115 [Candidatus Vidania fulgoroideae]|uniref:Uncharacterized protein n=1 Tax=Candidatus Vidania fulgoroideorum TaxID=881286 RepID=A0A975ADV2_9PROT|nr:hypothetical protein JSR06_00115 [Candidatus Vidania fulgoroideae]
MITRIFYKRNNIYISPYINGIISYNLSNIRVLISPTKPIYGISCHKKLLFIFGNNCFYAYISSYNTNPINGYINDISIYTNNNKKKRYIVPIKYSEIELSLIFKKFKKTVYIIRKHILFNLSNINNIPALIYLNLNNIKHKLLVYSLFKVFKRFINIKLIKNCNTFYTF